MQIVAANNPLHLTKISRDSTTQNTDRICHQSNNIKTMCESYTMLPWGKIYVLIKMCASTSARQRR